MVTQRTDADRPRAHIAIVYEDEATLFFDDKSDDVLKTAMSMGVGSFRMSVWRMTAAVTKVRAVCHKGRADARIAVSSAPYWAALDVLCRTDQPPTPQQTGRIQRLGSDMNLKLSTLSLVVALTVAAAGCSTTASTNAAASGNAVTGHGPLTTTAMREIDTGSQATIDRLFVSTPGSRELVDKARGVLVFPRVIDAGLVVGGEYGQGMLRVDGAVDGYYKTTSASVGLQVGAESKALVFLFMTQDALDRFRASRGWAGGIDASVAFLKLGANGAIDVNTARAPTLAFVMTNSGLMANLSLEGTKVTRLDEL